MHLFALLSPIVFVAVVTVLGFVTPGYSHLNHTISRLAIEKYGWIQTLNFLQFAVGLIFTGVHIAESMDKEGSRRIIKTVFTFSASILILAAITPTDPIENVRFSFSYLSPLGIMHVGTVIGFLLVSPLGISRLYRALGTEPHYNRYAPFTTVMGFLTFMSSMVWFVFYLFGVFLEYRGIFQKAIALIVIIWIMTLNTHALKLRQTKKTV